MPMIYAILILVLVVMALFIAVHVGIAELDRQNFPDGFPGGSMWG